MEKMDISAGGTPKLHQPDLIHPGRFAASCYDLASSLPQLNPPGRRPSLPVNRLANEKSPYLLQHAHNPVDWYPWGEEAFEKARARRQADLPFHRLFHLPLVPCDGARVVRERADRGAAESRFRAIKVDREERPDVDRIYMTFVQATTGGGGWPMSVWLTPDLKPFFGGTYFPPENRYGHARVSVGADADRRGLADATARRSSNRRATWWSSCKAVVGRGSRRAGRDGAIDAAILDSGFHVFRRSFDSHLGGFGGAPKFPRPSVHQFSAALLRAHRNEEALDMVLQTLLAMEKGGMHDQLGGGFHRYSVDERWFVPHFEKMLYDQAQLVISYLEAFQITRDEQYAADARGARSITCCAI